MGNGCWAGKGHVAFDGWGWVRVDGGVRGRTEQGSEALHHIVVRFGPPAFWISVSEEPGVSQEIAYV